MHALFRTIGVRFLEAGITEGKNGDVSVRPQGSVLVNEEDSEDEDMQEARKIAGKKEVVMPSREEYEEHMRTHIPYRKWCPFCVQGKMSANPKRVAADGEESEVPIIQSGA